MTLKEIISKADSMTKTLDTATHVTRVLEIFKTCQAHSCIWTFNTSQIPILYCFHWVALFLMKTKVILLTLLTAIWNTHASAVNTKLLNFETVLTLCNYLHVFIIFRRICGKNKLLFFWIFYFHRLFILYFSIYFIWSYL